jgi:hypothetical protein
MPRARFSLFLAMSTAVLVAGCAARPEPAATVPSVEDAQSPGVTVRLPSFLADGAQSLHHTFAVVNSTGKSVNFREVKRSCGCSDAQLARGELAAGEKTSLTVNVNPRGWHGPHRFSFQLVPRDDIPPWSYTIETTIYQPAQFSVPNLFFGGIEPRAAAKEKVLLLTFARGGAPASLASVRYGCADIAVSSLKDSVEPLPDGFVKRTTPLEVFLAPQSDGGQKQCQIYATLSTPGHKEVELPVKWNVLSYYKIAPARATFEASAREKGQSVTQRVEIRRIDNRPARILAARVNNKALTARVAANASTASIVVLTLATSAVSKPITGEVTLTTDDPNQPELTIPFVARP